jgi:hypothetical protein
VNNAELRSDPIGILTNYARPGQAKAFQHRGLAGPRGEAGISATAGGRQQHQLAVECGVDLLRLLSQRKESPQLGVATLPG